MGRWGKGERYLLEAYELCEVIPSYRVGQSVRIAFYSCLAIHSLASMTFSRMLTSREETRLSLRVYEEMVKMGRGGNCI